MAQKDRIEQICAIVRDKERVVVSELSRQFHVTEETIRRDLEKLEAQGLVTRTFGGAILNGRNASARTSYAQRTQMNVAEKKTIARIAAGLIPKHRCVIGADSSSTVFETICLLKGQSNLLLMTYAANILQELVDADMRINVHRRPVQQGVPLLYGRDHPQYDSGVQYGYSAHQLQGTELRRRPVRQR